MRTYKEKIMSQNKQVQKVKMFRILKVLFYCLGLPLFVMAVFFTSIRMIGHTPFSSGATMGSLFTRYQSLITAPALYGFWLAFGIWLLSAIVHIIATKAIKNRRVSMFIVVAVTLVSMLGTAFTMDYLMNKNIEEMIAMCADEDSPYYSAGVNDYKTQLSSYRTLTSGREGGSLIDSQINRIQTLLNAYNVGMTNGASGGFAGNMANNPVYYDELIYVEEDESGVEIPGTTKVGVDISYTDGRLNLVEEGATVYNGDENFPYVTNNVMAGDGNPDNDHALVRLKPNENGYLEINGKIYENYYYARKLPVNIMNTSDKHAIYVWYNLSLAPSNSIIRDENNPMAYSSIFNLVDGAYGEGYYNTNGMPIDGAVLGLNGIIELLEDYYAKDMIVSKAMEASDGVKTDASAWYSQIVSQAASWRDDYYAGVRPGPDGEYISEFEKALYQQDITILNEKFSLTRGELDGLVAELGAFLGSNSLFDMLLGEGGLLGDILGPALDMLEEGCAIGDLLSNFGVDASDFMPTVCDVFEVLLGKPDGSISDIVITLKYKTEDVDHLLLAILDQDGNLLIDIDFDRKLLGVDPDDPNNNDYAFDLDHLDNFLNTALNNAVNKYLPGALADGGIVRTILDLLKSLLGFDLSQYNIFDSAGNFTIDIGNILHGILEGLYWYQSPFVKPIWEFYVNPDAPEWEQQGQKAFADYDRAYYVGAVQMDMIGSTIIGDTIGTGSYPASFGLGSLSQVRQLKLDLTYITVYYPLYGCRDMIYTFAGTVVLFMVLSFVCAEKEHEYATGRAVVKERKFKFGKKFKKNEESTDRLPEGTDLTAPDASVTPQDVSVGEGTAIPQDQKSNKEVL